MNKKQTAVEWLFLMLNNPNRDQDFANKLFEKAKEMERRQIIEAWLDGGATLGAKNADQYFTETYGTK